VFLVCARAPRISRVSISCTAIPMFNFQMFTPTRERRKRQSNRIPHMYDYGQMKA